MPIFKKPSKSEDMESPIKPTSLAVALGAQRAARKKGSAAAPMAESSEPAGSIADAIMAKRKAKKMADGGMVESNEEETPANPSPYDDRNEAVMKEHYGDDMDSLSQPEDSNEHGDDGLEADVQDMVSAIRKRMASRR